MKLYRAKGNTLCSKDIKLSGAQAVAPCAPECLKYKIVSIMAEFKEGDVVVLKSGGPKMTIETFPYVDMGETYNDRAKCVWFSNYEIKRDVFKVTALKLSE